VNVKPLIVAILFLLMWEAAVRILAVPNFILPAPSTIAGQIGADADELVTQAVPTAIEIWLGFAIAVALGLALAVPIAYFRVVEESLYPILVGFEVIPKVAFAPLFIVWLGFGMAPKVTVAALIAFFPIVINTVKGLRSVEAEMVQWMRSLGAKPWEIFLKLTFPWSLPYLFAAMKVSMASAVVGAIVGEFMGTDSGLGYVILRAESSVDTPRMFAALFALALLGIGSFMVVVVAERSVLAWQQGVEAGPQTVA
jgi:NitT/TauT family transport system permease protein